MSICQNTRGKTAYLQFHETNVLHIKYHRTRKAKNQTESEYSELEGTHKDYQVQLLSEWPIRGLN